MKIYIICPYNRTGGPRSLHQLGNNLISKGLDVYMYYGDHGRKVKTSKLLYSDSNAKIANNIEDKKDNVVITSEYDTGWLLKVKRAKKIIWWLSLTYYLNNDILADIKKYTISRHQSSLYVPIRYWKRILKDNLAGRSDRFVKKNKDLRDIYHLYNCEYVRRYLILRGVKSENLQYLCGPIDLPDDYYVNKKFLKNKRNLVVYNPAKMNKNIISKIEKYFQEHFSNFEIKALQNMSHDEVLQNLKEAKVYIDLGYFPGPERMPREAVMQYCNIITSVSGSAANDIDVPIPKEYKFNVKTLNISVLCNLAVDMCNNFTKYTSNFDKYRMKVQNQIERFDHDIEKLCRYINMN